MTDQPLEPRLEDEEQHEDEVVEEPAAEESAPAHSTAEPAQAPDDSYLRLAADFDNYRKRVAREQVEWTSRANERLLNELLPVLDDLERALEAAAEHEEAKLEESEASTIEGRIMELRSSLESTDVGEIRQKTDALNEASRKLADVLYAQASAQAQSQAPGNGDAPVEDEVVEDADYEVIDEEEAKTS